MKNIDMRFDESVIKDWIGKKFVKYKCDAFDFTNSVTQIVGLYIDDDVYAITNIQKTVDYYGTIEDISVCSLNMTEDVKVKSAFKDTEQIITPVNGAIKKIVLINENQRVSTPGESYDVWLSRGIIFEVDGREISFEKDIVPFSEEIIIRKGYDLEKEFSSEKEFLEGWDNNVTSECKRQTVVFTE